MASRSTSETCCLTLPLRLEKWQSDRLEKRFEIARSIYNTLVNYELKKLKKLEQSEEYANITSGLLELYNNGAKNSKEYKELFQKKITAIKNAGFSEYDFKTDMKDFYKHFSDNIGSSVAMHGIAPQVWAAFEQYLFKKGKAVHFKKRGDIYSLRGYSYANKSGGLEIIFKGTYIEWKKLKLPIKLDPDNSYETEMLEKRVKYCRIIKKPGKKIHGYVQLSLEGKPAIKVDTTSGRQKHQVGSGTVGIDIGPQTIAYVSNSEAGLKELADGVRDIERKKTLIQRKMDRSRRATNPELFNEDGTVKRGIKLNWKKSKRYIRLQTELASLQHEQADIRKRQHIELANHLMSLGDVFYIEDMEWPALTKRSKKTEISEKTGRFKRKKRFGKSVGNKAPAMLIGILDQKLKSCGLRETVKVPTSIRASQYNHITGEYVKKNLGQRWNVMPDGKRIQRDLYSAFLLQHTKDTLDGFDNEGLNRDYISFTKQHNEIIEKLRFLPKTISSMGLSRTFG